MDILYVLIGVGCMAFGLHAWVQGDVGSAVAAMPLGLAFVLLVPIRRRGGDASGHWVWLAAAVVIVALLWAHRSGLIP